MTTVTGRVKIVKQPRGGFIPIKDFATLEYNDGIDLLTLEEENISPNLVGLVVDYLTRFYIKEVSAASAFGISLRGAMNLGLIKEAESLVNIVQKGERLTNEVIISACKLASFDAAYRVGPQYYNPNAIVIPNGYTINAIAVMVERALIFFGNQGELILNGVNFDPEAFTNTVVNGDGDFMTEKGLWDMKVSVKKPDSKHTLQILVYYILGLHSPSIQEQFKQLETLGFFNPRSNISYSVNISQISKSLIDEISSDVIGY